MKHLYRYLTLLALLGGAAAPRVAHAQSKLLIDTGNPGPDWTLVAGDEFGYSGLPDPALWHIGSPYSTNKYAGWGNEMYSAAMVNVAGGSVHLKMQHLLDPNNQPISVPDSADHTSNPRMISYVGGMISSVRDYGLGQGGYGIYEARIKVPADPNSDTYPAFWLYNAVTEIDVMDGARVNNNDTNPGLLTGVILWGGPNENRVHTADCGRRSKIWADPGRTDGQATLLSQDYNTYTVVWTPAKVTFFLNKREICTVASAAVPTVWWHNLDVMLSLSNTSWTQTTQPFTMDVDYVRLLRPTCVVAGQCKDYEGGSYPPYKSDYEVVPHDISQPNANIWRDGDGKVHYRDLNANTTNAKMSDVAGSLALNPNNEHQVFYRGFDDLLYVATEPSYPNGWTVTPLPPVAGLTVAGDVRYNAFTNSVLFKGSDGQLHAYAATGPGGTWQHSQLTQIDATINPNALVSGQPGSVACRARDGFIAYIGRDQNIRYFTPNAPNAPTVSTITTWDSAAAVGGDVQLDDANILYRGQDNRLQVYYQANNQYYHNWVDNGLPNAVRFSSKPGSLALSPTTDYYVGTDDHVHSMTYNHATGNVDYADLPAPGSWFEQVQGDLTATPDDTHVFYRGKDGRIQTLYRDASGWHHAWDDDYFTTGEFTSFTGNDPAERSASLVTSNGRQFYCDAYHHLRYLAWEPAEVSDCTADHNEVIGTLHRTGTAPTTPAAAPAPAAAAAEVLDLSVAPNPTASQLTVVLPTALRALSLPYTLISALGAVVQQGTLTAGHLTLALGSLPSGLYVLTTQAPGHVYHTRVVKE